MRGRVLVALCCALGLFVHSDAARADVVLDALEAELERAMEELGQLDPPPYFIAVELTESHSVSMLGEDGALHGWQPQRRRWLDVDIRIGSRELDSSHPLRDSDEGPSPSGGSMPLTDDPLLIQRWLWRAIDDRYRSARERWARVEAERQVLVAEEPAEDLVPVEPAVWEGEALELRWNAPLWEETLRTASAPFGASPSVTEGSVSFRGEVETRWFASTEGARLRHSESRYRVTMDAVARAEDGTRLSLFRAWDAAEAEGLPDAALLAAQATELEAGVNDLLVAPLEEPYTGPLLLSDRAAGVFFHEVFGHRVEGHRLKQVNDAQTFRNQVGQQILPTFLSVYDDPTTERLVGVDLRGHYHFDAQGVPAERVTLVDDGVLQGFLQSRSPVERGDRSNGHGRRSTGRHPVARQGNLIIEAAEPWDEEQMRAELIRLAEAEGLPYALAIDEIQGGFTFTGRAIPNAFKVDVRLARRIYVDGRPDELVRGFDLIGTPLEAFASIVAAGPTENVFNGSCGAESGWVPVSAVSPSLLLRSGETQRESRGQRTPPLLPPPVPESPPDPELTAQRHLRAGHGHAHHARHARPADDDTSLEQEGAR